MAFFKFRQRGANPPEQAPRTRGKPAKAAAAQETVDTIRRRARHRLLGAVVLVLAAVIGFPMLFDAQPRPVAVNASIAIPEKNELAPLRVPDPISAQASLSDDEEIITAEAPATATPAAPAPAPTPAPAPAAEPKREQDTKAKQEQEAKAKREAEAKAKRDAEAKAKREAEAKAKREQEARAQREQQARRDTSAEAKARQEQEARAKREAEAKAKQEQEARAKREADAKAKREAEAKAKREAEAKAKREAEAKAKRDAEAARARALLEGRNNSAAKPAATDAKPAEAKATRFIVQIGAYADAETVRQTRQKAERAGLKTYIQVVKTSAGERTRVRVGPFNTKQEAEQAAATLKKAGLGGSVQPL